MEICNFLPLWYLRTGPDKNGQNRQIVIFLETMDPGGSFGMVIARIGRVVIFWQVFEVGDQPAILAKGPVRGVLGS